MTTVDAWEVNDIHSFVSIHFICNQLSLGLIDNLFEKIKLLYN